MLLLNLVTSKGDACHLQLRRLARSGVLWLRNGGEVRSRNFSLPNVGVEVMKPSKPAFPCFHLPPPKDKFEACNFYTYIYISHSWFEMCHAPRIPVYSSLLSLFNIPPFAENPHGFFVQENPGKIVDAKTQDVRVQYDLGSP